MCSEGAAFGFQSEDEKGANYGLSTTSRQQQHRPGGEKDLSLQTHRCSGHQREWLSSADEMSLKRQVQVDFLKDFKVCIILHVIIYVMITCKEERKWSCIKQTKKAKVRKTFCFTESGRKFWSKRGFLYGSAVFNGETHKLASLTPAAYPAAAPTGPSSHLCRAARSLPA